LDNAIVKNPLWAVLVETVHSLPLYRSHKAYLREIMLVETPTVTPEELSERLGMSLGEALVIMEELNREKVEKNFQTT
jgi:hypothetical protein